MIQGLGIDIIEVERIATRIAAESGFRELVFSESEILYCEAKTNKYEHYAARFAAKEAFLKALGSGWTNNIYFNEIEITNNKSGKPELTLKGKTKELLESLSPTINSVSLSHLKVLPLLL
ncbi:MAG: holo-ACP synthase [Bacteroidetes bacterium]|nr:holo-ACP synthase [Bacteroidota bacterium]